MNIKNEHENIIDENIECSNNCKKYFKCNKKNMSLYDLNTNSTFENSCDIFSDEINNKILQKNFRSDNNSEHECSYSSSEISILKKTFIKNNMNKFCHIILKKSNLSMNNEKFNHDKYPDICFNVINISSEYLLKINGDDEIDKHKLLYDELYKNRMNNVLFHNLHEEKKDHVQRQHMTHQKSSVDETISSQNSHVNSETNKWMTNAIYNNNFKIVLKCLSDGELIYDENNNNTLYDALLCNHIIGNIIYILLCELQNISIFNIFHQTDEIIIIEIKNIIYDLTKEYRKYNCEYNNNNKYRYIYDENSFNFKKIYELYYDKLIILNNKLMEKFCCETSDFLCINKKNISDNIFFKYDDGEYINKIRDILLLIESYYNSVNIIKLLFNQQFYECITRQLVLLSTNKLILSEKIHEKQNCENCIVEKIRILLHNNTYININYINPFTKSTILIDILSNYNFSYVIKKIFDFEILFKHNDMYINHCQSNVTEYELILMSLNKKMYDVTIMLFEKVSVEILDMEYHNTTLYFFILNNNNIDYETKLNMLSIMIDKNVDFSSFDSIKQIIHLKDSYRIIEILLKNKNIIKNLSQNDVILAIMHKKNIILKLLFENGININGDENHIPIFTCLELINKNKCDYDKFLEIFITILEYKPNLEILNDEKITPLLYAVKTNNPHLASILLDNGADPFAMDDDNTNCLIYAIIYDQIDIIKYLLNVKKNNIFLINIKNKKDISSLNSILYSSKPVQILLLLQKNTNIEYNIVDKNGCNILDNIIDSKLTDKTKEDLCKILINYVDIVKINDLNPTPTIIRAINKNLVNVVKNILYNLAIKNEIIITSGHLDKFLGGKCENITIDTKNKDQCNFYSLVIIYLKNIIYGNMVSQKNNCLCANISEQHICNNINKDIFQTCNKIKKKQIILDEQICQKNTSSTNENKKNQYKNIIASSNIKKQKNNYFDVPKNMCCLCDEKYCEENIIIPDHNIYSDKSIISKNTNNVDIFYHANNDNYICSKNNKKIINNTYTRKKIINLLKTDLFFIIIILIIREIRTHMQTC